MGRKDWTSEKIFDRLINNKSERTYWDNVRELRKRANQDVYNQAYKLVKSDSDNKKMTVHTVLQHWRLI